MISILADTVSPRSTSLSPPPRRTGLVSRLSSSDGPLQAGPRPFSRPLSMTRMSRLLRPSTGSGRADVSATSAARQAPGQAGSHGAHRGEKPRPRRPATAGPALEDHGRTVTANHRRQRGTARPSGLSTPPRPRSVGAGGVADPAFGLAIADLSAITRDTDRGSQRAADELGAPSHRSGPPGRGDRRRRAADLFLEHLANVGCDPLAFRIAAHLRPPARTTTDRIPPCHPTAWTCCS